MRTAHFQRNHHCLIIILETLGSAKNEPRREIATPGKNTQSVAEEGEVSHVAPPETWIDFESA